MTQQMARTSGYGFVEFSGTDSEVFGIRGMSGGGLTCKSGYDGGAITFWAGPTPDDLEVVSDIDDVVVSAPVGASKSVPIPREVFLFPFVKMVCALPPTAKTLGFSFKS